MRSICIVILLIISASAYAISSGDELLVAVNEGRFADVRELLSAGVSADYKSSLLGLTPLHIAVGLKDTSILSLLLSSGAKPDVIDNLSGKTPLIMAVERGNYSAVEILIRSGADTTLRDEILNRSVLEISVSSGDTVMAGIINSTAPNREEQKASFVPTEAGKIATREEWDRDSEFFRLIMNRDTVGALREIDSGASPSAMDPLGFGILHHLVHKRDTEMMNFMFSLNVSVDERDAIGNTPLMLAAQRGFDDICGFLIEKGADINAMNLDSATPLFFASQTCSHELIKKMLNLGANVNTQVMSGTWRGWTPLMVTVIRNNAEMIQTMLDAGADMTVKNFNGWTAYKLAIANGREIPAQLIKEAGAKIGIIF